MLPESGPRRADKADTEEFKRDAVRMMRNRGARTVREVADDAVEIERGRVESRSSGRSARTSPGTAGRRRCRSRSAAGPRRQRPRPRTRCSTASDTSKSARSRAATAYPPGAISVRRMNQSLACARRGNSRSISASDLAVLATFTGRACQLHKCPESAQRIQRRRLRETATPAPPTPRRRPRLAAAALHPRLAGPDQCAGAS